MQQCSEHIALQLPNKRTCLNFILDAIMFDSAPLQADMVLVCNEDTITGKMNNFEGTAAFLLPHDPIAKQRMAATKWRILEISNTSATSNTTSCVGIGHTGVHFRYYKYDEFKQLSPG